MVVRDDFRGITFSPMSRHICRGWTIYGIDKYGKEVKADANKIDLLREMPPALLVTVTRGAGGILS